MPRAFIRNSDYWLTGRILRKPSPKPWAVGLVWPDTHRYFEFETWSEALDFAVTATRRTPLPSIGNRVGVNELLEIA